MLLKCWPDFELQHDLVKAKNLFKNWKSPLAAQISAQNNPEKRRDAQNHRKTYQNARKRRKTQKTQKNVEKRKKKH